MPPYFSVLLLLLVARAYRLVTGYLPPAQVEALAAETVQLHFADPRRFLAGPGAYDLILVAAGEPESGRVNRLYTREFYSLCRARLRPGGVLAFQLEAAENLWSPALLRRTASIHRAVTTTFADVLLLPGETITVVASDSTLSRSAVLLAQRWRERGIRASLVEPGHIEYLLADERGPEARALLDGSTAPANTDARPGCYPYTLILWLSRFYPRLGTWQWSSPGGRAAAAAGLLLCGWVAGLVWARRRSGRRAVCVVATAGFAGMLFQSVLLLHYQTLSGVLYQDLGLLITAFMAGLTGGALLLNSLCRRCGGALRWLGAAMLGDTVLLCLLAAWVVRAGLPLGLAGCCGLLLVGGFEVGGLFAWGSVCYGSDQGAAIAPLYAADLLGGCVAAVAGTVLLIPALGLDAAMLLDGALIASLFTLV